LFQSANGTSTKPASVVSLNSISVTKSCTASTKKLTMTTSQARNSTTMGAMWMNTSGKPAISLDLVEDRRRCVDTGLGQPPRLQEVAHAQGRAAGRQAQPGEGTEHDARQHVEVADDVGEGTDVQHLADQLGDHVLALAGGMAHRPEQPGERHVDDDQRGREERHLALQQPEARVDVARENVEEAVDDRTSFMAALRQLP
jgi:hypothetical protein